MQNEALAKQRAFNRFGLAGIGVHNVVQIQKLDFLRGSFGDICRRAFIRFPKQRANAPVLNDFRFVVLQIPIHIDFQEGENADFALGGDFPFELGKQFFNFCKVRFDAFVFVEFREFDSVFVLQLERKSGIDDNFIVGNFYKVRLDGRFVFNGDGHE